jgi:hypothetical protein
MIFRLTRFGLVNEATPGFLTIEGRFLCWTLEDRVREQVGVPVEQWKVPGKTAIPVGTYPLRVTWSPRFKTMLPHVDQVPGFSGVRIHAGNTVEDTEGCILVGLRRDGDRVWDSRIALDQLLQRLGNAVHTLLIETEEVE